MAIDLPSPPPLSRLIAQRATALFLDFDGTLVDIAPTPDAIHVPDGLARRIDELAGRLAGRLALVSGRGIADLERHLGPLPVACAGSHGADLRSAEGKGLGVSARPLPRELVDEVREFAQHHGLFHETKPHGAALHWRRRPEVEQTAIAFAERLADEHHLTVKRGKGIAELVAPGADKGTAVRTFLGREPFSGACPIFVGDDVTDEDGFAAARALGGLAIAVGEREADQADYALADVAAVHHWLWP